MTRDTSADRPDEDPALGAPASGTASDEQRHTAATSGVASFLGTHELTRRSLLQSVGAADVVGLAGAAATPARRLVCRNRDTGQLQSVPTSGRSLRLPVAALGPLQLAASSGGTTWLPFLSPAGSLAAVGADGRARTLLAAADGVQPATEETRLAVGDWAGDRSVFFADDARASIYRATWTGGATKMATPASGALAVAGVADLGSEGSDHLVFVGSDRRIRALDASGSTVALGPDSGARVATGPGVGVGSPAQFGHSGRVHVPLVDDAGDLYLHGTAGRARRLTEAGSVAARAPMATQDLDGDRAAEIAFVGEDGQLRYVDDVLGSPTVEPVTRRSIAADPVVGVVGTKVQRADSRGYPTSFRASLSPVEGEQLQPGALALDGETALVGQPAATGPAGESGVAQVFAATAGGWQPQATLAAAAGAAEFGVGVSLAGTTAVVGDPLGAGPDDTPAGAASVFTRSAGTWSRTATLAPADPSGVERFGDAVAVANDRILVGAPTATAEHGTRTGLVAVYERRDGDWTRSATIEPPRALGLERFGRSIAVDGSTAVVGARLADSSAGAVVIYECPNGRWRQATTIAPDHRTGSGTDEFGVALALADGRLLVGAPAESNANGDYAGGVSAYDRSGGSWGRRQHLLAPIGRSDGRFGTTVAIDGRTALVAADGNGPTVSEAEDPVSATQTTVFVRSTGQWRPRSTLTVEAAVESGKLSVDDGTSGEDLAAAAVWQGPTVALDGARALVGAAAEEPASEDPGGSVRVFDQ